METRKVVIGAVAILVIIATAVIIVRKTHLLGGIEITDQVLNKPVEKVDTKTLEVMSLPLQQWVKLGGNEKWLYKNPKTGEFTMATPITCRNCGAKIPEPELPVDVAEAEAAMRKVTCAKCGKCPYGN